VRFVVLRGSSRAWRRPHMRNGSTSQRGNDPTAQGDDPMARPFLEDVVRQRPLVAIAAAGALGAAVGGVLFTRLGRLGAVVAAGYLVNGLWHRDRGLSIEEVIEGLLR
jgi:hypothetical protein